MQSLTNLNKQIIAFLELPAVQYSFLAIIVLRILAMGNISVWYLNIYDYTWFRVFMGLLIAYTALFDPIYSIALATLMILSIQELHRRRASVKLSTGLSSLPQNIIGESTNILNKLPTNEIMVNNANVFNEINKHSLQKDPTGDDSILAEYDYYFDPAFKTLTQTVTEQNTLRNGSFYVNNDELQQAQNNLVTDNQNIPVTALPNSLNAQGIPIGFDRNNYSLDSKVL